MYPYVYNYVQIIYVILVWGELISDLNRTMVVSNSAAFWTSTGVFQDVSRWCIQSLFASIYYSWILCIAFLISSFLFGFIYPKFILIVSFCCSWPCFPLPYLSKVVLLSLYIYIFIYIGSLPTGGARIFCLLSSHMFFSSIILSYCLH